MKVKVIAYSDNICPFCFIGAKRFEKLKQEVDFDIEWRGFEIHPEVPKEGIPLNMIFQSLYLNKGIEYMENLGKDIGLKNRCTMLCNSHLSLKANEFAKKHGMFNEFHLAIFKAYFEENKNIGKVNVILDIAESVGLNKQELEEYLQSDEAENILKENSKFAFKHGITGVPTFIIGDSIIVGAQPYDFVKNAILKEQIMVG